MQSSGLRIGEVAARAGVPTPTPRFYERRGECAEVRRVAEAKIAAIDEKIRDLQRMRDALESLGDVCSKNRRGPCPILATFGEDA